MREPLSRVEKVIFVVFASMTAAILGTWTVGAFLPPTDRAAVSNQYGAASCSEWSTWNSTKQSVAAESLLDHQASIHGDTQPRMSVDDMQVAITSLCAGAPASTLTNAALAAYA